jgi:hypothetical protein
MPCDGRYYGRLVKEELDPFVDYLIVGQHALACFQHTGHWTRQDPFTRHSVEPFVRKVVEEREFGMNIWRTAL